MAIGQGFLSMTFTYINEHKLVRTRHVATIAKGQAHAFCNRQPQLSHSAWTDVTQILWSVIASTLNPNGFAINKIRLLSSLALTRKLHDARFLSVSPLLCFDPDVPPHSLSSAHGMHSIQCLARTTRLPYWRVIASTPIRR